MMKKALCIERNNHATNIKIPKKTTLKGRKTPMIKIFSPRIAANTLHSYSHLSSRSNLPPYICPITFWIAHLLHFCPVEVDLLSHHFHRPNAMEICLLDNEEKVLCHLSQLYMRKREDYSVSWYKQCINHTSVNFH